MGWIYYATTFGATLTAFFFGARWERRALAKQFEDVRIRPLEDVIRDWE